MLMDKKSLPKIYGVLGYPARHSLSPLMHNAAFQALKINAEYRIFEKEPKDLEDFIRALSKENIYGLNVTLPYKEIVLPSLNSLSDEARQIGAVNTIKISGRTLEGFNTDGEGFLKHLIKDLKFNPIGKTIAIIGAGGASKAICVNLAKNKPKIIAIYDIDKTKTQALISHLKKNFKFTEFRQAESIEKLDIQNAGLLVNATPIGMKESDPSLVDEKFFHKNLLVYDVIYNPKETKLLKTAKLKGCLVSCGLGMLLYQGALSFELWMGKQAPIEAMRIALDEALTA